ncbi:Uncharacterised protein [Listeria monocytogenes]|nr:Uncharacterised protein [Listeria monocytogenes]CWV37636.1 Uncharacterised protein [Listeria monocytogenes]
MARFSDNDMWRVTNFSFSTGIVSSSCTEKVKPSCSFMTSESTSFSEEETINSLVESVVSSLIKRSSLASITVDFNSPVDKSE